MSRELTAGDAPGGDEALPATETQNVVELSRRTSTTFYVCPVDKAPCSVTESVAATAEVVAPVVATLPCNVCRRGHQQADELAGVRLGMTERWILRNATPPGGPGMIFLDAGTNDPVDGTEYRDPVVGEVRRRAQRKLTRIGLIEILRIFHTGVKWRNDKVWLTPLGDALASTIRRELESGAPIRWRQHLPGIHQRLRKSDRELLTTFRERLVSHKRTTDFHRTSYAPKASDVARWKLEYQACERLMPGCDSALAAIPDGEA